MKLRLDLPGTGCKPTKHMTIMVLNQHDARALLGDVPTELGEAVPVELGREEQTPAVPLLPGQVGVDKMTDRMSRTLSNTLSWST